MNKWFGGAAALSSALAAAHILGGTPEFLSPVLQTGLAPDIRAVAAIVWHAVSLILIVNSVVLIGAAMNRPWGRAGVPIVAAQYLGFVGLFIFLGISFLGNITDLPQWTAFAAISAMVGLGMRATPARSGGESAAG
ncbi:MAG: hypothetical protein ACC619_07235 [Paracoccaceae bacterium]